MQGVNWEREGIRRGIEKRIRCSDSWGERTALRELGVMVEHLKDVSKILDGGEALGCLWG